jgi:hypothetical protein
MKTNEVMPHIWADIHQSISEASAGVSKAFGQSAATDPVWYPPGVALTLAEQQALASLRLEPAAKSAIAKLVQSACAVPLFHLFALLDGVGDPANFSGDVWLGGDIVPAGEDDREMLHDEFVGSYPG